MGQGERCWGRPSPPTPRFWGRSQRPEAKTGALSGNREGMNFSPLAHIALSFQKVMWSFHPQPIRRQGPGGGQLARRSWGPKGVTATALPRLSAPQVPSTIVPSTVRTSSLLIRRSESKLL